MPEAITGVGFRLSDPRMIQTFLDSPPQVDFLEIVPECFIPFGGHRMRLLTEMARRWPLIMHGVSLSIGGTDPFDSAYLQGINRLSTMLDSPYWSDHLAISSIDGVYQQELLPLPWTPEAADHVVDRVRALRKICGLPLILENIAYYLKYGESTLTESQFLQRILDRADVGLLLDISNIHVNCHNYECDPRDFIRSLPMDRVGQLHLGGFTVHGDLLFDSHSRPVSEDVWDLFSFAVRHIGRPVPVCVEWETDLSTLDPLAAEIGRARAILAASGVS